MKSPKIIYLSLLAMSVIMFSGCEDDPVEEVSPLIGDYTITNAALSEALTLVTNEIGPIQVPVDTDMTAMIQTALLGAIECTPENSLIELRYRSHQGRFWGAVPKRRLMRVPGKR